MKISALLKALINVAEKGANIARIVRSESSLLELLVQEKKGNQKNNRFVQDFKTLADVLVQEVVKFDLRQQFPEMEGSIYGEESNKFTNVLGDRVVVEIQPVVEKTQSLLSQVLDGNDIAAKILAEEVHRTVNIADTYDIDMLDQEVSSHDLGVWIDPIDATSQYIQGDFGKEIDGMVAEGLQCVAVLIGVYNKNMGLPLIGVTNQPFYNHNEFGSWASFITWGVCIGDIKGNGDIKVTSLKSMPTNSARHCALKPIILGSASEAASVQESLKQNFVLRNVTGAGYKLLGVCQSLADAYIMTKSNTYKWDCCGPHAILLALGGGIVKFSEMQALIKCGHDDFSKLEQIKYHVPDNPVSPGAQRWCNHGGIVAYRSPQMLIQLATSIKQF